MSDPRFEVFKSYVESLAKEKGLEEEFKLYEKVAFLAPQIKQFVQMLTFIQALSIKYWKFQKNYLSPYLPSLEL